MLACDGDGHKDERLLMSTEDGGKTWKVGTGDMRATAPAASPSHRWWAG